MKKARLITAIIVLVLIAAATVLYVYTPLGEKARELLGSVTKETAEKPETEKAKEDEPISDVNEPADVNEKKAQADVNEAPKPAEPNEPNEPTDPNLIMEALNLKDVEIKNLVQKLAEWTDKVIIPDEEALKQKVTIYAPAELPRKEALSLIYSALRAKGIMAEHTENAIFLRPMKQAKLGAVPTIPADYPLAAVDNKDQIVQKFFDLKNYSAIQMSNIILPLVGEYGYVSADEDTGSLLVIDTVKNLIRIERIITQFDIPSAAETVTEIFVIKEQDPAEIVQLLRLLLSDGDKSKGRTSQQKGGAPSGGDKTKEERAASVVIESRQTPVVLIPEPKRKWIIAKGSADDIRQVGEWIEKLDKPKEVESEYETISLTYADAREVADRLNRALQQMPGAELKTSVLIQPLVQARQIMIFGRSELREMVKKMILEVDIPPGDFEEKTFKLKHADAEELKKLIEELYEDINADLPYWRRRWRDAPSSEMVRVIAYPTLQQLTIIASPENMIKIENQIKEWDVPLDIEKVKPMIITLQNSDPVKMAELLSKLFTEETTSRTFPWWWYFEGGSDEKKKIVGALYGQLTFEAVPETKKIIVISKIPEAYTVIRELIIELDRQEMAEVPKVIVLKYADPEDLAERLNAIFNEPGTVAKIRLGRRGLSEYGMEEDDEDSSNNQQQQQQAATGEYTPPWNTGQRRTDEMPISNVIGRIRFIPDPRSKAILCLAPPEFMDRVENMIKELDVPGQQVMIRAIVVEVRHDDLTSLGIQLASNELSFGNLEENAITALGELKLLETHGSITLSAAVDVTSLIDFLIKKIDAKILNQQTLWTKDNEEADFFKGQKVAFTQSLAFSQEGGRDIQSFEYSKVGMTLRVKPNITPQKTVDMEIDLTMSQITPELINNQPVRTWMNTTTNALAGDGETVTLGGILFQEDSTIRRKLPLLGDVPVVGGLFRHEDTVEANNELIVFITPFVIDEDPNNMLPETIKQLEQGKEQLDEVLSDLENNKEIEQPEADFQED